MWQNIVFIEKQLAKLMGFFFNFIRDVIGCQVEELDKIFIVLSLRLLTVTISLFISSLIVKKVTILITNSIVICETEMSNIHWF